MPAYSEVPDCYDVNNYVDRNATAGAVQDWNCGTRTYDGHGGMDIDLWPFWWNMMDNNYVAVVAAAAGRIVAIRQNQNNESNCAAPGENTTGNYIGIRHADSSTSFYYHIRTNSAQVSLGQIVNAGDVIAFIGSSGLSSNPHLHFEANSLAVNDAQAAGRIDPYTGGCNPLNTWWLAQKPYREPAIVRVMTHGSRPSLPGYYGNSNFCRNGEVMNAKSSFAPNDSIYFGVATRDFLSGQSYSVTVFDPNNAVWFTSNTTTSSTLTRSYNTVDMKLPAGSIAGTYRVEVIFNGTTTEHFFTVNCRSNENVTQPILGWRGYKSSNTITASSLVDSGNRLLLQAATRITLSPGFTAKQGSILKARIKDCNYSE